MEFVVLLVLYLNHVDGSVMTRAFPTPNHQICEEVRANVKAQLSPAPEGIEVRTRCISSELLAPGV